MSERQELVVLAAQEGVSIAELARRFSVSRKTVYKWLARYREHGVAGLADRSRRPLKSARRTPEGLEQAVVDMRKKHPAWGGRKISRRLKKLGVKAPAPSTISRILGARGLIDPAASAQRKACRRFQYPAPNDLWQMDFKSPISLTLGGACHTLTVLDDHSRYSLGVRACVNQKRVTVESELTRLFKHFGLPWAMLSDNGSPWRVPRLDGSFSRLEVWLMRLDIGVKHGRPFHPQTQGKDERFHRTMEVELLQGRSFRDCASVQCSVDPWREVYNHERPHEALDLDTPSEHYQASVRSMPSVLPLLEYDAADEVRRVDRSGQFRFHRRKLRAGKAFVGESVALRPTQTDGLWHVYFGRFKIGEVDLNQVGPNEFAHIRARLRNTESNQPLQ